MSVILSRDGRVRLPKVAREQAGVQPGEVFDVISEGRGQIVLRRRGARRRATGLFNIKPLPPGTFAAIYAASEEEWAGVESAATQAQAKPQFDA